MKTKHILTALALPALFAACTADDIVSMNEMQQDRAKLSKSFVLTTNNSEVESRYAVEGSTSLKFSFEEGDMIGANLIDQFAPGVDDPADWPIIYSVNPALPFKNVGEDQWKSDSELGVGNYLFTYPYNAKDNNRAAALYELPLVQDLTEGDLNAVIEANNMAVGATVLYEGQTEANVSMKNLFTYPKFVLKFAVGQSLKKVNKVVLEWADESGNGKFLVKGGYNHKKVAALFADDYKAFAAETGETAGATSSDRANALWEVESGETYDSEEHTLNWDLVQTEDLLINGNEYNYAEGASLYGAAVRQSNIVVELNQNVKTDADGNKYVEVRFIMPSVEDFLNKGMKMYAFADNGVYEFAMSEDDFEFKATTSAVAKKNALQRSRTNTLTFAPNAMKPTASKSIVTTVSDWNKLVALYGADKDEKDFEVSIVGSDFAFDETAEMPSKAIFVINTPVAIDGKVALKNVTAKGKITVKEDAELTIDETVDAQNILNKGILNIVDEAAVAGIENEGTLNVAKDGKLFLEYGAISRTETEAAKVKVVNKGIMNVAEGGDVKADIDNLGALNISGYVNSTVINGKAADAKKEDNEKAIITMGATEKAILKGAVTNYKHSKIVTAKDATVVVSTNSGEIVFVDGAELTASGGTISYVTEETSFGAYYFVDEDGEETDKTSVNTLILTKDATFAGTAEGKAVDYSGKTIVLKDGVDITVAKDNTLTVGTLKVEGKNSIAKTGAVTLTNLEIVEGGDLITNAPITATAVELEKKSFLTVGAALSADTFKNEGSVTNNSTVTVREGGLTGEGSWTGDEVTDGKGFVQEDYEKALYDYVAAWARGYATVTNGWEGIVNGIIADCPVAYSMKNYAEDLLEAYNGYKLEADEDALTLTQKNMKAILEAAADDDVEELQAAVATLKAAVETELKGVLTNKVAETDEDGELVFNVTDWNPSTGYATLGGEKKGDNLGLRNMWTAYVEYLSGDQGIVTWTVEVNSVQTNPYKNHDNGLIRTYQMALASIVEAAHMTGSYTDEDGEVVEVVPVNPDLAIPAGSYIDASNKTGASYVVVNAWNSFVYTGSETALAGVKTYTKASYQSASEANKTYLNYIANWCYELNRIEEGHLSMDMSKVKASISSFVSTVVNDWEEPEYSQKNLEGLLKLLNGGN